VRRLFASAILLKQIVTLCSDPLSYVQYCSYAYRLFYFCLKLKYSSYLGQCEFGVNDGLQDVLCYDVRTSIALNKLLDDFCKAF
jgi:hypothetical protein